jgi:anti-sigma factor RsiW
MSERHKEDEELPPAWLAGHVDGELSPTERERVVAWLRGHPDAATDVEGQRRLARLWEESAAQLPDEASWAHVLARVEAGLATRPAPAEPKRRRAWVAGLLGMTALAAAAVLLAVLLRPSPGPVLVAPAPDAEEPWPVVSVEDVRIVSMDDADREALVIGNPPVTDPLVLLGKDEVKVSRLEPDERSRVPQVETEDSSDFLMIVMPPMPEEGKKP